MRNMVILQKDEDGNIICSQLSEEGKEFVEDGEEGEVDFWCPGGTIVLEELDEILDREI